MTLSTVSYVRVFHPIWVYFCTRCKRVARSSFLVFLFYQLISPPLLLPSSSPFPSCFARFLLCWNMEFTGNWYQVILVHILVIQKMTLKNHSLQPRERPPAVHRRGKESVNSAGPRERAWASGPSAECGKVDLSSRWTAAFLLAYEYTVTKVWRRVCWALDGGLVQSSLWLAVFLVEWRQLQK